MTETPSTSAPNVTGLSGHPPGVCHSHGWLDTLAVSMSALCAVHCLITPLLLIAFPLLATTFWVHQDFHLWMVFLVIPTTSVAMFLGCRKHKDKLMLLLSALGMGALVFAALYESFFMAAPVEAAEVAHCALCASQADPAEMQTQGSSHASTLYINLAGGLLLASAHVRNFLFCRRASCRH
jgi:hypothetical protein